MLHFQSSEQGPIKLMRRLMNRVAESVSSDKELVKELKRVAERLKMADKNPEELLPDQANLILGKAFIPPFSFIIWFVVFLRLNFIYLFID